MLRYTVLYYTIHNYCNRAWKSNKMLDMRGKSGKSTVY